MCRWVLVWTLLLGAATSARAGGDPDAPPPPTPFDRGRVAVSLAGGTTSNFGHSYVIVGGGVGYYVLGGVELSLSGLHQFGSGPSISELSPGLRYVARPLVGKWPVIPYAGVFYNHWFIGDGIGDIDSTGGRAGGLWISGKAVLGLGVVVERIVSECDADCTSIYPDVTIALTF